MSAGVIFRRIRGRLVALDAAKIKRLRQFSQKILNKQGKTMKSLHSIKNEIPKTVIPRASRVQKIQKLFPNKKVITQGDWVDKFDRVSRRIQRAAQIVHGDTREARASLAKLKKGKIK